ncbi:MAG: flagellar motor switch protein FliM [Myxococcales bacterium]|nr:flagellar motor switch protein FliM [Myxococcales bacterium]
MAEVLSQDEVNALLRGISDLEGDPEQVAAVNGVEAFDFASQERIIRGRMPTLEIVMDKLARSLRQTLSMTFSRSIYANVSGIGMRKFGSFIKSLPVPSSMHIYKLPPLKGAAMLYLEARLVFAMIDYFFGGPGEPTVKIEGRDFTAIETRLIKKVVDRLLLDLETALSCIHPIRVEYGRSEINPLFAAIVPPSDLVVKIDFEVQMEHCSGQIVFCIPYSSLEPIREVLSSSFQSERFEIEYRWTEVIREIIGEADMELEVLLGKSTTTVGAVRDWAPGTVLTLNQRPSDPLTLLVEGEPRFRAYPGDANGNTAVQVVERIDALPAAKVVRTI